MDGLLISHQGKYIFLEEEANKGEAQETPTFQGKTLHLLADKGQFYLSSLVLKCSAVLHC